VTAKLYVTWFSTEKKNRKKKDNSHKNLTKRISAKLHRRMYPTYPGSTALIKKNNHYTGHRTTYLWLYNPLLGLDRFFSFLIFTRPPLWSSGPSSWLQIQRSRVRFPALRDSLRSSGCGTGSTQPREDNWGATWKKNSGSGLENRN
jgi:hypothetical protein